ncbi:MAG: hypothetical protein K0S27_968 [Gammaproteobacteria bacterium]|jgi:hypothetical protein|nr:hypothetical protein [Gammaproteobacteria bacterium]
MEVRALSSSVPEESVLPPGVEKALQSFIAEIKAECNEKQEKAFSLGAVLLELQNSFLVTCNRDPEISSFYEHYVVPCIKKLDEVTTLEEVDSLFKQLCGTSVSGPAFDIVALVEDKKIIKAASATVRKNYIRLLELYRFYFMYEFIRRTNSQGMEAINKILRSLPSTDDLEEKSEKMELEEIQAEIVKRNIANYLNILEEWDRVEFLFSSESLERQAEAFRSRLQDLDKKITAASLEEKFTFSSDSNSDLDLLFAEMHFSINQRNSDFFSSEYGKLQRDYAQFIEEVERTAEVVSQEEALRGEALKNKVVEVRWEQEDDLKIRKTPRLIKIQICQEKYETIFCQIIEISKLPLVHMQRVRAWLNTWNEPAQPSPKKIFSSSLRKDVFLKIEIENIIEMFTLYADRMTRKSESFIHLINQLRATFASEIQSLEQEYRLQIIRSLKSDMDRLQSLKIQNRGLKCASYLRQFKLSLQVELNLKSLRVLNEEQIRKINALNEAWQLLMRRIMHPFQKEFGEIKQGKEIISEKISKLTELYMEIERQRASLVMAVENASQLEATRRTTILAFINIIPLLMREIRKAREDFIKFQLAEYQSRFSELQEKLKYDPIDRKKEVMQELDREIMEFVSRHTGTREVEAKELPNIKIYLDHEILAEEQKELLKSQFALYKARFLELKEELKNKPLFEKLHKMETFKKEIEVFFSRHIKLNEADISELPDIQAYVESVSQREEEKESNERGCSYPEVVETPKFNWGLAIFLALFTLAGGLIYAGVYGCTYFSLIIFTLVGGLIYPSIYGCTYFSKSRETKPREEKKSQVGLERPQSARATHSFVYSFLSQGGPHQEDEKNMEETPSSKESSPTLPLRYCVISKRKRASPHRRVGSGLLFPSPLRLSGSRMYSPLREMADQARDEELLPPNRELATASEMGPFRRRAHQRASSVWTTLVG